MLILIFYFNLIIVKEIIPTCPNRFWVMLLTPRQTNHNLLGGTKNKHLMIKTRGQKSVFTIMFINSEFVI